MFTAATNTALTIYLYIHTYTHRAYPSTMIGDVVINIATGDRKSEVIRILPDELEENMTE